MSNSSMVSYTRLSPNYSSRNGTKIDKITIHHMAVVNGSLEAVGESFAKSSRQASSNYAIDGNGKVAMYVPESMRAWTSSNKANDMRAITIEVANSTGAPDWKISDKAMSTLIDLCVDICKRNDIKSLNYTGDTSGNLTRHDMFTNTECPGPYLRSKFPYIATQVNSRLNGLKGDVNSDGKVNTKDLSALIKNIAGYDVEINSTNADMNDDGKVNAKDVTALMNQIAGEDTKTTTKKSVAELAEEVIAGKWGNGNERKSALTKAGYDYAAVQERVNWLLTGK